jgi:hypothetical protein
MKLIIVFILLGLSTCSAQFFKTNGPVKEFNISEVPNEVVRIQQQAYRDTAVPSDYRSYEVSWDVGSDVSIDWLESAVDWPLFSGLTNIGPHTGIYPRQSQPFHPLGNHVVDIVWGYLWEVSDIFRQPRTNIFFRNIDHRIPEEYFLGMRVTRADGPHHGWVHVRRPATNAVDPEVMILAAAVHPAPNAPVRTGVIPPQPVVNTTVDGGAVVFTWHADYATFRLETTVSLDDPVTWLPVDTGGAVRHVLTPGAGNQFFRLVPP